ncbi:MAG: hypothetical protein Ct9H300mP29_8620 [Candidatus Neomarinimicrobiota bacterium]|nr:MAG: hypothetical protein Ct9H300mP29_8620 [Candidatus Neomarinimicrobiota bacterium]
MLYDQAMLAMAYTEAFQLTGNKFIKKQRRNIDLRQRDMTHSLGGFYSAEDADRKVKKVFFI